MKSRRGFASFFFFFIIIIIVRDSAFTAARKTMFTRCRATRRFRITPRIERCRDKSNLSSRFSSSRKRIRFTVDRHLSKRFCHEFDFRFFLANSSIEQTDFSPPPPSPLLMVFQSKFLFPRRTLRSI